MTPAYTITAEAPPLAPALPAGASNFVASYVTKVDAKLAEMPPDERLPELQREQVRMIGFSEEFAQRVDSGKLPKWGETAVDYALMLAEISKRISQEVRR